MASSERGGSRWHALATRASTTIRWFPSFFRKKNREAKALAFARKPSSPASRKRAKSSRRFALSRRTVGSQ